MMKLYFSTILTLVLVTTGCAQIALHHDRADPCQGEHASPERKRELGRPDNYKRPDYCFSSVGKPRTVVTRIYNAQGQIIGYVK